LPVVDHDKRALGLFGRSLYHSLASYLSGDPPTKLDPTTPVSVLETFVQAQLAPVVHSFFQRYLETKTSYIMFESLDTVYCYDDSEMVTCVTISLYLGMNVIGSCWCIYPGKIK
ncbi:hypothetical protein HOH87_03185, partial [bacterium]|nr:hypothetical protein [bacterium]